MSDYVLIDSLFDRSEDRSKGHGTFVPYGLAILDITLKTNGYDGQLLLNKNEYEEFIHRLKAGKETGPSLVGVTASSWTRFDGIRKIKECRQVLPNALIVAGGFHFGKCAEDSVRNIKELDIVVRGEGDEVILELMELALGKRDFNSIEGITYRGKDGRVIEQGPALVVDSLPSLDFMDISYSDELFKNNLLDPLLPIPAMNILAGRGCPNNCVFCSVARVRNRTYPVVQIVDKIEEITGKYGIRGVKFWDDSLTLNRKFVYRLCDEIEKRKLDIRWFCDSRADISLEMLKRMYEVGCRFVSVGLETGSPRIQKIVDKKVSNDQVLDFVDTCKQVGIKPFIFLMAGLPDEGPGELDETVRIAAELSKRGARAGGAGITTILPGTRLEVIAKERGILPADFSWTQPYNSSDSVECGQVSYMPIYKEKLSATQLNSARQSMLTAYANSLPPMTFIREAVENLFSGNRTLDEKIRLGKSIMHLKIKSLFSGYR